MATEPEPSEFNPLTLPDPQSKQESGLTNVSLDDDNARDTSVIDMKVNPEPISDLDSVVKVPEAESTLVDDLESMGKEPETEEKFDIDIDLEPSERNHDEVKRDFSVSCPPASTNESKSQDRRSEAISSTYSRFSFAIPQNSPIVLKAELGGSWLNRHILFVIRIPNGEDVRRRFNDFLWLRNRLRKIYVGAFIPPLPERLPIAMWPKGHLKTRKRELQIFMKRCSICPFITEDSTWQYFFKSTSGSTFEKARKKWDKSHLSPNSKSEICEQLEKTFPNIIKEPLPDLDEDKLEAKFTEMHEFIQESVATLQRMHIASKRMSDAFVLKVDSFMNLRESLQEYETTMDSMFADENQEDKERLSRVVPKVPAKISESLSSWCQAMHEVPAHHDLLLVHNIKKNMMEMQVVEQCFTDRFKVLKELNSAKTKAAKWSKVDNLRAKDVARKHADVTRKDELEMLSAMLYKIITNQLKSVWQTSQYDFRFHTERLINMQVKKYGQVGQIWRSTLQIFNHNSFDHFSL